MDISHTVEKIMKEEGISDYIKKKTMKLLKNDKVEIIGDDGTGTGNIIATVEGTTDKYEIIYNIYAKSLISCSCPFFIERHGTCSHMQAVKVMIEELNGLEGIEQLNQDQSQYNMR